MSMTEFQAAINGMAGRTIVILLGIITTGFSAWAAQTMNQIQDAQLDLDRKVTQLQVEAAVVHASRFSVTDWKDAAVNIGERFNALDIRVTRLEETNKGINEALLRIEKSLGTNQ